jgi:hypothetical protein
MVRFIPFGNMHHLKQPNIVTIVSSSQMSLICGIERLPMLRSITEEKLKPQMSDISWITGRGYSFHLRTLLSWQKFIAMRIHPIFLGDPKQVMSILEF